MQGIIALSNIFVNVFCLKEKQEPHLQIFLQFNVRHSLTNDFLCDIL